MIFRLIEKFLKTLNNEKLTVQRNVNMVEFSEKIRQYAHSIPPPTY